MDAWIFINMLVDFIAKLYCKALVILQSIEDLEFE